MPVKCAVVLLCFARLLRVASSVVCCVLLVVLCDGSSVVCWCKGTVLSVFGSIF